MYIALIEEMMKNEEKDHVWLPSGNYLIGEAVREWVEFSNFIKTVKVQLGYFGFTVEFH